MIWYIILLIAFSIISYLLGRMSAIQKNKNDNETAIMVISNLKATIEIYKITNEQQKKVLIEKNNELKIEIGKLKK